MPVLRVPVILASRTLGTGGAQSFQAPGALGTGVHSVFSAPGTLGDKRGLGLLILSYPCDWQDCLGRFGLQLPWGLAPPR